MERCKVSLVALLVMTVAATTLTGCAKRGLLKINDEKVQKDEFYARLVKVPVQTQQGPKPAGRYVIEQMINEKLMQQLAADKGVAPTETQINKKIDFANKQSGGKLNQLLASRSMTTEDFKRQLTIEQSFINVSTKGITIPDSDIKATYQKALNAPNSTLKRPEQIMLSAIITTKKDKIDKAYKLLQDKQEFTAVAGKMTDDPAAKKAGGKLDWVAQFDSRIPANIRKIAFSTPIGSYGKPILIGKNWIILRADQKRPAKVTSYDEIKEMIREQLAVQKAQQTNSFPKVYAAFVKKSDIVVNADRWKDIPAAIKKQASQVPPVPKAGLPGAAAQP